VSTPAIVSNVLYRSTDYIGSGDNIFTFVI